MGSDAEGKETHRASETSDDTETDHRTTRRAYYSHLNSELF